MSEEKKPDIVSAANDKIAEVSSAVGNIGSTASESAAKVTESVKNVTEKIKVFTSTSSGTVIVMLVIGAAVALLTAYILYWLINRTINNRNTYMLPGTKIPIICTKETKLSGKDIPNSANGHRLTICFWIYIYDINKYSGSRRHVFHRGAEGDDYLNASPYIYLDAYSNKLHVMFSSQSKEKIDIWGNEDAAQLFDPKYTRKTQGTGIVTTSRTLASAANSLTQINSATVASNPITLNSDDPSDEASLAYLNAIRGITIDYIPLQRWVHVGIVVNEDLNGGTITAYIDGQLQSEVSPQTKIKIDNPNVKMTYTSAGSPVLSAITTTNNNSIQLTVNTQPLTAPAAGAPDTRAQTATAKPITPKFDIKTVDLDHKGDVYIGGSLSSAVGAGFSGLISKVQFFNYDLNAQDVYNNYLKGPIDNLLAKMGLPPYGVRNPIYKLQ